MEGGSEVCMVPSAASRDGPLGSAVLQDGIASSCPLKPTQLCFLAFVMDRSHLCDQIRFNAGLFRVGGGLVAE